MGNVLKSVLTVIDGNSLLFRAFYGVHGRLTRTDGTPVNAVYGFCNMILPLLAAADSDDVFVCAFDATRKNWRHDIYQQYKANRIDTPVDLLAQIEIAREAVRSFGIPCLTIDDVEADDVIATLTAHECAIDRQIRIITSDKDLMQLVSGCCFLFDTMKNKEIHEPEVFEKFGVRPDQVVDAQSLIGDSSDNVPGVPGIGPKKAAELLNDFGTLDNLYANIDSVQGDRIKNLLIEYKDQAFMSRKLVSLKSDVNLPAFNFSPFKFDFGSAIKFASESLESPSLISKIKKLFQNENSVPSAPADNITSAPDIKMESSPDEPVDIKSADVSGAKSHLISSEADLDKFLSSVGDVLAIDTETTGLDQMTARLVGISLATSPTNGAYIPLRHISQKSDLLNENSQAEINQMPVDVVKKKLWPVLTNPKIVKVGHNLKYDFHILENENWDTNAVDPIDDTMLLSYALHGTMHQHNLDELAKIYLEHENISFDSLFPTKTKNDDKSFANVPIDKAVPYAAEDAFVCFALYKMFKSQMDSNAGKNKSLRALYENCDRPLMRVLLSMERNGVLVDKEKLHGLSAVFHEQLQNLSAEIFELAGREFNIASPLQLANVLYDDLHLAAGKKRSTDASTLYELSEDHPIIPKILQWRSIAKLAGTYTDALPHQIGLDGRIHTTYLQTSTNTGRLSSRDPNLQNIPIKTEIGEQIRKCFIASPGNVLIAADYSQIQLRLLAHLTGAKFLTDAFSNGRDIHEMTAHKIFKISPDESVPKNLRRAAKTINFSIIYGISQFGLADQLKISNSEAKKIIDSYMSEFPEINEYINKTSEFVKDHACVYTPWGRRIEIPEIRIPRMRAYALRAAINAPIQGFEADIVRLAMIRLSELSAKDFGMGGGKNFDLFSAQTTIMPKMIMQVHDEIVFECDERASDIAAKKIKAVMENVAQLSVPIVADCSIGKTWDK